MRYATGPLLAACSLIGVAGAVHGVKTDRWRPSSQLEDALSRIPRVPSTAGDWKGEDVPFEAEDMARAGIQGCVFRHFRNARTRESVTVLLVCGRGGPISVHTPDVCYAGAGYRQQGDAQTKSVESGGGQNGTFRVVRFGKTAVVPAQLEIYWGWSRDGRTWDAPDSPRVSFARLPALYKMYVVREFVVGTREEAADSCRDFLQRALPEFGHALAQND